MNDGTERCLWCDELAVAWCDEWLGCVPVMDGDRECISFATEQFLCDAPMCVEHQIVYGRVCGDEPDTLDVCPAHAKREPLKVRWKAAAKSPEAAERVRSNIRAVALRSRMRVVS